MENEDYRAAHSRHRFDGVQQPKWNAEQLMRMIAMKADMKRNWEKHAVGQRELFGELIVAMNGNIEEARRDDGDDRG